MEVIYKKSFLKAVKSLPWKTQELAFDQILIFKDNQNDPRLHVKKLLGKFDGFYSLRLTRDYRLIYYFENKDTVKFVDIGNRKDIYK